GPSSLPASRADLIEWAGRVSEVVREAGGEPALYMVWPDASRRFAFPDVEESYAQAAAAVNGRLLPAGTTWLAAWEEDPDLPLYAAEAAREPRRCHCCRLHDQCSALRHRFCHASFTGAAVVRAE